jgi:hypothetical protein
LFVDNGRVAWDTAVGSLRLFDPLRGIRFISGTASCGHCPEQE